MGFSDFLCEGKGQTILPPYPSLLQVHDFLSRFSEDTGVINSIRFNHRVTSICKRPDGQGLGKWQLQFNDSDVSRENFDALIFCNGRHSTPAIPTISGIEEFQGKIIHSLCYRNPEMFKKQKIAVLGTGPSGEDISRQLSLHAKQVYVCARPGSYEFLKPEKGIYGPGKNISRHGTIQKIQNNSLILEDNTVLTNIDTLFLCTGYQLDTRLLQDVPGIEILDQGQSVWPLYLHMFYPEDHTLGFIGLPRKVIPFWLYQYQGALAAAIYSGRATLPTEKAMMFSCSQQRLRRSGTGSLHKLDNIGYPYINTLAVMAQRCPPAKALYSLTAINSAHRKKHPENYRDIFNPRIH